MFVIIGWVLVLASVIGSFVGVGGHLAALVQPFELLCIFGAAIGAFVAVLGSVMPAWTAQSVKVSEVFSKVA